MPAGAGAHWTRKPNPNLKQRPPRALFCLKLNNSCCYAHYSCGNNYNVVVKLVQECKFFRRILFPFYGNSSPGTNSYKRAIALRNSWLIFGAAPVTYLQALAYADKPRSMSTLLGFNVSVLSSWLESSTPAPTDVVR